MAQQGPERRGWRGEGGPTVWEFALAIVLILGLAVLAVIVLGSQTSAILSVASGGI